MLKDLSLLVYNPSFGVGLPVQSVHFEGKRSKSLNAVEVCGWKEAELILLDFILFFLKINCLAYLLSRLLTGCLSP